MRQEDEVAFLGGYADNVKGYRLYDPVSNTITVAGDGVVLEKENDSMTAHLIV